MNSDPSVPTLPSQYTVTDTYEIVDTNAGYPSHVEETLDFQYYDLAAQKKRIDVSYSSYQFPGPYFLVYDYTQTFDVQCGKETISAPRVYNVLKKTNQCCFADLVQDCDANPQTIPSAESMYTPAMPQKIKYMGTTSTSDVCPDQSVDWWQQNLNFGNEVPPFTQDFYFDAKDSTTQKGLFMHILAGVQFINATTQYKGDWTLKAPESSVFDISALDCSQKCNGAQLSSVDRRLKMAAKAKK
jgi:hypothetical protein